MPKARKKAKKSKKIRKAKSRRKAPEKEEGRHRELLLAVINRLGASVTVSEDPDTLIVKQFNSPPFMIYGKHFAIEDVPANPVEVSIPVGEKAAE